MLLYQFGVFLTLFEIVEIRYFSLQPGLNHSPSPTVKFQDIIHDFDSKATVLYFYDTQGH